MSVLKEWECPVHGDFEGTHPVCPEIGCEAEVKQVFRTPVAIGSQVLRRFDAGIKKSVDMMGLGNLRSARAGETSYGGDAGKGVLWGDDIQRVLGVDLKGLLAASSRPLKVTYKDGHQQTMETSVLKELAAEGATRKTLPRPAELMGDRRDHAKPRR